MKKQVLSLLLAVTLLLTMLPVTALSFDERQAADSLNFLGLFKGVGVSDDGTVNYALSRTPTRSEAITMLVRLLGKEKEATGGNWTTPFTDVENWALPYVGYAYANGLTSGTGATTFSGGAYISATQYITFVLRALGYSDNTDFSWKTAWELSDKLGFTSGEFAGAAPFDRGDIASISCNALSQTQKNTSTTLLSALLRDGAVNTEQITASGLTSALTAVPTKRVLTSEEIYAKCAPAVFFITTYDVTGAEYAYGSGFFIDADGTGVTNCHVIKDAFGLDVSTMDGNTYSDISVLAFDIEQDVVIFKVNGASPFPYLTVNSSSSVTGGQQVYAIGNPQGLMSTISAGLISNPSRADFNNMIQISVPISAGSSGGALINQCGEVIGITTAGFTTGQNLNFSIPIGTAVQLQRGSGVLLAEVAKQRDIYDYQYRSDAFADNYNEIEPNDVFSEACFIENGMSIWGYLTDGYCDTVLARCNTTGTIEVFLYSKSSGMFADDMVLYIGNINGSNSARGQHLTLDDGTLSIYLEYEVTEPGIYNISIISNSLYQYYNLYTDYAFYYLFTPDA